MHDLIPATRTLLLAVSLATLGAVTPAATRADPAASEATVRPTTKKLTHHLEAHQTYPATRTQLLAACNDLVEFSAAEKAWLAHHLPEGTYASASEVLKAVDRR